MASATRPFSRFEWIIVVFQYAVLCIVAAAAATALLHGTTAVKFTWTWFSWSGLGGMKGLMGGILIACFMYSGWDASIYVNEETTDRAAEPELGHQSDTPWRRGRDTAATLRDIETLQGRLHGVHAAEAALWRGESLRYRGLLDEAGAEAETARRVFEQGFVPEKGMRA